MDFLKTLMLYMTLLTTLSVQEGPLPQDVPMPTAAPAATATFAPFNTEVPTATPSPKPAPTPQMTPNARYETLRFNDRGNEVRRLQNRLIALGYMPAGSADGAYGYQTYNAVQAFQRANGLSDDGVAGPMTLTHLYENPAVVPKMTATPVPTASPTPSLAPIPTPAPVTPAPVTPTPTPTATPVPVTPTPAHTGYITPTAVPTADLPLFVDVNAPTATPTATPAPATPTPSPTPAPFVLTEVPEALVISGNTGRALVITQMVDGIEVPLSPMLWVSGEGKPVMSLRDLVDCYEGWTLTGSAAEGRYELHAAGYDAQLLLAGDTVRVSVGGRAVNLAPNDVRYRGGVIYVSGDFLTAVLDANVIFDADERSLVLFIRDKTTSVD